MFILKQNQIQLNFLWEFKNSGYENIPTWKCLRFPGVTISSNSDLVYRYVAFPENFDETFQSFSKLSEDIIFLNENFFVLEEIK